MSKADLANAVFEGGGAILTWLNVFKLRRDREVKGVDWRVTAFWSAWGLWNCFYYPMLGQTASAYAGVVLCVGNCVWVYLAAWRYRK